MPRIIGHGRNAMPPDRITGMTTDKKPICYAPFLSIYANQHGDFAPCCISRKFRYDTPEAYWHSNELGQFRQQMLDGHWPDGCGTCQSKSEAGLRNDTQVWDRSYELAGKPKLEDTKVRFLDLRTSNLCNLKCRMCGPGASSQWNDEIRSNTDLSKWHTVVEERTLGHLDYFTKLDLVQVSLLGGEPTIDPVVAELMRRLGSGEMKPPKLRFTTNGTNLNQRFRTLMSGFEEVHVAFSVDAVGQTFEYIRTNASWERVESNIRSVMSDAAVTECEFNTILMPYNVFGLVDLLAWYRSLHSIGHRFRVSFYNSDLSMTGLDAVLPHHLEQETERVRSYLSGCDAAFLRDIPGVTDLVDLMSSVRFSEFSHNAFKMFNADLDRVRGTDVATVSPHSDYR